MSWCTGVARRVGHLFQHCTKRQPDSPYVLDLRTQMFRDTTRRKDGSTGRSRAFCASVSNP
jgi:hypothetical protein